MKAATYYEEAVAFDPSHGWAHAEAARNNLKLLNLGASRNHLIKIVEIDASARLLRAQSMNVSQSHIGQLIDEFCVDAGLLRELRQIRQLPIVQQLPPLRKIVKNNPDYTPAAILFFIALRQGGFLKGHVDISGTELSPIPRRIVQYWNTKEPPDDIRTLMDSWIKLNPQFEYVVFDDASAQDFLKVNHPPEILRAYVRSQEVARKADLFRLGIPFS